MNQTNTLGLAKDLFGTCKYEQNSSKLKYICITLGIKSYPHAKQLTPTDPSKRQGYDQYPSNRYNY